MNTRIRLASTESRLRDILLRREGLFVVTAKGDVGSRERGCC